MVQLQSKLSSPPLRQRLRPVGSQFTSKLAPRERRWAWRPASAPTAAHLTEELCLLPVHLRRRGDYEEAYAVDFTCAHRAAKVLEASVRSGDE
jgi:hypothetical protein